MQLSHPRPNWDLFPLAYYLLLLATTMLNLMEGTGGEVEGAYDCRKATTGREWRDRDLAVPRSWRCVNLFSEEDCGGTMVRVALPDRISLIRAGNSTQEPFLLVGEGQGLVAASIGPCYDPCDPRNWAGVSQDKIEVGVLGGYNQYEQHVGGPNTTLTLNLEGDSCVALKGPSTDLGSIQIPGDSSLSCVELHAEANCGGGSLQLRPGYPGLQALYYWRRREFPKGNGFSMQVKALARCGAACGKKRPPEVNLVDLRASPGENWVTVFDHPGYYGTPTHLNLSGGGCITLWREGVHVVGSLRVPHGLCVLLYSEWNCRKRRGSYSIQTGGGGVDYYKNKILSSTLPPLREIKSIRLCRNQTGEGNIKDLNQTLPALPHSSADPPLCVQGGIAPYWDGSLKITPPPSWPCLNLYKESNCEGEFLRVQRSERRPFYLNPGQLWDPEHGTLLKGDVMKVTSMGRCYHRCDPRNWQGSSKEEDPIKITAYRDNHFQGKNLSLTIGAGDEGCIPFPGDLWRIDGIKIHGPPFTTCVELHDEANCGGDFFQLRPGYPTLNDDFFWGQNDVDFVPLSPKAVTRCGSFCNKAIPVVNPVRLPPPSRDENIITVFDHPGYYGLSTQLNLSSGGNGGCTNVPGEMVIKNNIFCMFEPVPDESCVERQVKRIRSLEPYSLCLVLFMEDDCKEKAGSYSIQIGGSGLSGDYYLNKLLSSTLPALEEIRSIQLCGPSLTSTKDDTISTTLPTTVVGKVGENSEETQRSENTSGWVWLIVVSTLGLVLLVCLSVLGVMRICKGKQSSEGISVTYKQKS